MLTLPPHIVDEIRMVVLKSATALGILIAFWIAAALVARIVLGLEHRARGNRDVLEFLSRAAKASLIVFGVVTALGTAGVNVAALVAGLGLTGFALGFAFRDVLSNMVAGVLLLLYRPFGRGDHISVTGLDGVVAHIDLRYTVLQAEDKTVLLPNSSLFTNPIVISRSTPPPAEAPRT